MEKILAAWNIKTLQEFVNISKHLERNSVTVSDVMTYLRNIKHNESTHIRQRRIFEGVLCDVCGKPMELHPVNTTKCSQIEDKTKHSQWWCRYCDVSNFNTETVAEMIERKSYMGRMVKNPVEVR